MLMTFIPIFESDPPYIDELGAVELVNNPFNAKGSFASP
jgi:hypothetical protein